MKFHKQLFSHNPEQDVWGDCHRTCIACLLDLEVEEVPHFNDGGPTIEIFLEREKSWLKSKGLYSFNVAYKDKLDNILYSMRAINPGIYYMLAGQSSKGMNHSVIGLNDKIVHDPADSRIIGPCDDGNYWITVLAKENS